MQGIDSLNATVGRLKTVIYRVHGEEWNRHALNYLELLGLGSLA